VVYLEALLLYKEKKNFQAMEKIINWLDVNIYFLKYIKTSTEKQNIRKTSFHAH
jgi:hypothetical protein